MMNKWWTIILFVIHASSAQRYVAEINMAGYRGSVAFEMAGSNLTMTWNINGDNVNSLTRFEIKSIPAIFGGLRNSTETCKYLGMVLDTINTPTGSTATLALNSFNSIYHRSILISSSNRQTQICATIFPESGSQSTYHAIFNGPIIGEAWLRIRGTSGLFIYSDLAKATGSSNSINNMELATYSSGNIDYVNNNCSGLTSSTSIADIAVGDSVNAAGKVSGTFVDSIDSGDLSDYLALIDTNNDIVACTTLQLISPKTVTSEFFWSDVEGSITMSQNSPFESTDISISLSGLSSFPAGYHVHNYPVPQRLSSSDQPCSNDNVGGHFNPYDVDIQNSPAAGNGTVDQYEIGDLNGKFGFFNSPSITASYVDWNLPLFGIYSVVGRSIVIHNSDGSRFVCASIGFPGETIVAVVKYNTPAYGYMYLWQEKDKIGSDVTIFGSLANLNGKASNSHNLHFHLYPVGKDCASTGGHFDPTELAAAPDYSTQCSPSNPFRCEIGDISGRAPPVNIDSILGTSNKIFYTDINSDLQGPYNVIRRSIVVHIANRGANRYVCGNITEVHNSVLQNSDNSWSSSASVSDTVSGTITFSQKTEFDRTTITSSITGLNNINNYGVYELPVVSGFSETVPCSDNSVSNQFNPFGVAQVPTAATTYNNYAVGDLSGKYGVLIASINPDDNNLPVTTGLVSIAGRSIAIGKDSSDTSGHCTTLDLQPGDNSGYVVKGYVAFSTKSYVGHINLSQVIYSDGSASVTTIYVAVGDTMTSGHNWHVHVEPIREETKCADAHAHFDPYDTIGLSSDYSAQCSPQNPLACEVGDLSSKHEPITLGERYSFVDVDLPLHTHLTVLGRSIVIHAPNRGANRIVCANILPTSENTFTIAFPQAVAYDYYTFTNAISKTLNIDQLRVIVLHNIKVPVVSKGCNHVMVTIAGTITEAGKDSLLAGSTNLLAPYRSTSSCSSQLGAIFVGERGEHGGSSTLEPNQLSLFVVMTAALIQLLIVQN